jgi:hypothetical protein
MDGPHVKIVLEPFDALLTPIDQDHVLVFHGKAASQMEAHLTRAHDDDAQDPALLEMKRFICRA